MLKPVPDVLPSFEGNYNIPSIGNICFIRSDLKLSKLTGILLNYYRIPYHAMIMDTAYCSSIDESAAFKKNDDTPGSTTHGFDELYTVATGGKTLSLGLYKWNNTILITDDVTFLGDQNDILVFTERTEC